MSLEAIDAALDRVPGLVVLWVELRWPATAGPALLAAADLVGLVRNSAADTATPQLGADSSTTPEVFAFDQDPRVNNARDQYT